jgi:hypothetical protein
MFAASLVGGRESCIGKHGKAYGSGTSDSGDTIVEEVLDASKMQRWRWAFSKTREILPY